MRAVAVAHPNIAVAKYWGKRDAALNLPAVPSLGLTLGPLHTRTEVRWGGVDADLVEIDGRRADPRARLRVLRFLDLVAEIAGMRRPPCAVRSASDFPAAAGLASSSSAFAALALAAAEAAGLGELPPERLSALARRGSGSACRSVHGGWVEWRLGERPDGLDSHGVPVAPADHWDVRVVVAVVSGRAKAVGSREGMERSRRTSPFFRAFVEAAPADVAEARAAVLARDLARLGAVMERSTMRMHAVMLSSEPPVRYWRAATLDVLDAVDALRARGVGAWATMDAGPNVKVLCAAGDAPAVAAALAPLVEEVRVLEPAGPARLVGEEP